MRVTLTLLLGLVFPLLMWAQAPVADFSASPVTGCAPLVVVFKDQSAGNPTNWNWDLSVGGLSTKQNPDAVAFPAGTYTITLTVRNADGISSVTKTNLIVSNPSPSVNFSADRTIACIPATINFTDVSVANAGTITKWEWGFDDLPGSFQQNPSHLYDSVGYYGVNLIVTNSAGCSSSSYKGRYIRITNGVKANFDKVGPNTCQPPFSVNYKNLTSGPGNITYAWDLGNGNTSAATAPAAIYSAGGSYTVKLKAQSDYGCADSIQKVIPINGIATTFTAPASVCLGGTANFQSTSSPAPVKVLWKFGDGTTSTLLNPTKSYPVAGTYTVTLYSTFANCSDSATKTIVVGAKPAVDFSSSKNGTCKPPLTVTFQNLSPDVVSANWTFGEGGTSSSPAPSVTHTYANTGSNNVTLSITDSKGCSNIVTKPNYVNIFGPVVQILDLPKGVCVGQSFSPTPNIGTVDPVVSYLWDFGDGGTSTTTFPSHSYATAGIKTIKLTVTTSDGCTASGTGSIQVGTPPVVNFSTDTNLACHSTPVKFTNLSTPPGTVFWNFGDGDTSSQQNPAHKFADTGMFYIKLSVTSNGCTDSLIKPVPVHILPPMALFGYKSDCADKRIVNFLDSTKNDAPAYGPLTYQWSFGDPGNNTATLQNPAFTYPSLGNYVVTLIAGNSVCTDTLKKVIQLFTEKADFNFDRDTVCKNERISFTTSNNISFIGKFQWIIDGAAPVLAGGSYFTSYATSGSHTVRFIKTGLDGCTDTSVAKTVFVKDLTAGFNVVNAGACKNSPVSFTDASVTTGGTIKKWNFDFGDSTSKTFTGAPYTHAYADTGLYTVKLTITDNFGCQDSILRTAAAYITKPSPSFGTEFPVFCAGVPLQFADSSLGRGLTYTWNFGDGGTSTLQNPQHIYSGKDSSYTVKLVLVDSVGCRDSVTRVNYINIRSPKVAYSVKDTITLCPPLETQFKFTGKDNQSVSWDFGDGSLPSTLDETSHFYSTYGNFTAKLYAYGFGGCVDSASISVKVINPIANTTVTFDPKTACNELLVSFNVTKPFGTSFTMFFGDGGSDTAQQPSFQHLYALPNLYDPIIMLKDSTGCQAVFGGFGSVNVHGAVPIFGSSKKKFCDTGMVNFTDYSQESRDLIVKRNWDFGDGNATVTTTPTPVSHLYTQPGLYVPTLTVTAGGCDQKFTDTIRVLATPAPIINSADGICRNLVVDFAGTLAVPPDTAITWKWDLGNGQTSDKQNVSVNYKDTGIYHITLLASNSLGCKGDTAKNITIFPLPAITIFGDTTLIAGGTGIAMPLTYSANATGFNWTPATNLSCTDCANPFATPKFTTTYKVKVTDANGCISSRNVTLLVICNNKNFFIPNTFSPNNDGANDRFYPRGTGIDRIQALRIFNRWGELVFEKRNFPANDAASGWDGSYKGKSAVTDTYIYMIDIICENANIITYKGNVTLIR